jgi:hypothetical protein
LYRKIGKRHGAEKEIDRLMVPTLGLLGCGRVQGCEGINLTWMSRVSKKEYNVQEEGMLSDGFDLSNILHAPTTNPMIPFNDSFHRKGNAS